MDTAVVKIKAELAQYSGLGNIIRFTTIEIIQDWGELTVKIDAPTRDDAFCLFHDFGRLVSKACEKQGLHKIKIYADDECMYSFSPKFRLSWI